MSGRANLIGRHHYSFDKRQLKVYCDSLVLSVLGYLLPVWGSISPTKLDDFDAILVRMVKKIFLKKTVLPSPRLIIEEFEKMDWLLAAERRDESMLKFFHKHFVMNNELNDLFLDMFKFRASTGRAVRKERNLVVPLTKTCFGQSSFSYRLVKIWNDLPASVQSQETPLGFSTHLRNHIITSRTQDYLLKFT
jgi:hypothetical protein